VQNYKNLFNYLYLWQSYAILIKPPSWKSTTCNISWWCRTGLSSISAVCHLGVLKWNFLMGSALETHVLHHRAKFCGDRSYCCREKCKKSPNDRTYFHNSFTVRLSGKLATNSYLNIPPHLSNIATLPCEIAMFKKSPSSRSNWSKRPCNT